MADELSIQAIEVNKPQQSQKSTTPYVLGGAALGGLGTGAYAYLNGKPVYSSYEDIVKEKEDTFNKTAEKFAGEDKKIDKFTNARKALVDADQKWENEFQNYVKENKSSKIKELEDIFKTKKQDLKDKVKDEIQKIKQENPEISNADLKSKVKTAFEENAELKKALEAKNTASECLKQARKESRQTLLEAFEKSNRTKKAALEEAANGVKDDLKVLMEKRIGTGKMAAIVAAGVVALGALGYLIAPKN